MVAVFCLRLALGMLLALAFLSARRMHPRFFRTHFMTTLGLSVVALFMGWDQISTYEPLDPATGRVIPELMETSLPPLPVPYLVASVLFTLIGSIVWVLERPTGGRLLHLLAALAMMVALYELAPRKIPIGLAGDRFEMVAIPGLLRLVFELSSAVLLGFAVTAMLVGHSYLISPTLSTRPLKQQILGLALALQMRAIVAGAALWFWSRDHDITNLNDESVLWLPVRWLVGLAGPLVLGCLAYHTARIRSTQSATGILYVVVILTFLGELTSLLLTRNTGLPL